MGGVSHAFLGKFESTRSNEGGGDTAVRAQQTRTSGVLLLRGGREERLEGPLGQLLAKRRLQANAIALLTRRESQLQRRVVTVTGQELRGEPTRRDFQETKLGEKEGAQLAAA